MKITGGVRREIKREQRKRVTQSLKDCVAANAFFLFPALLILALGVLLCSNIVMPREVHYGANFSMMDAYKVMNVAKQAADIGLLVVLLSAVVLGPLQMGLMQYLIALSRGKQAKPAAILHVFSSLKMVWRAIRMQFCLWFRFILWMLVPGAAYSLILSEMVVRTHGSVAEMAAAAGPQILVLNVLYWLALALLSVKVALYQAGYLVAQDHEELGMWLATAIGGGVFRGKFGSMLCFFLSFWPWALLYGAVSAGLCYAILETTMVPLAVLCGVVWLLFTLTFGSFWFSYQTASLFAAVDRLQPGGTPVMPSPLSGRGPSAPDDGKGPKQPPEDKK